MKLYLLKLKTWFTPMRTLIAILLLALMISILFRILTPKRPNSGEVLIVPAISQQASPLPSTIQLIEEYPQIEIPNEFVVTQFQVKRRSLQEITKLLDGDTKASLTEDPKTGWMTYVYSPRDHFDPVAITKLQKDKAIETGTQFVAQTLQFTETTPRTDQVAFYIADQLYLDKTESEQEATMLSLPFEYTIENGTAKIGTLPKPPIIVYIDSALQVRKAEFFPALFSSPTTKRVRSISPSEALKHISQTTIERFYRENDTKIPIQSIQRLLIKKVAIEYRIDPLTGISIPKYYFEGEAQGANNQMATLSFLAPAVLIELERN